MTSAPTGVTWKTVWSLALRIRSLRTGASVCASLSGVAPYANRQVAFTASGASSVDVVELLRVSVRRRAGAPAPIWLRGRRSTTYRAPAGPCTVSPVSGLTKGEVVVLASVVSACPSDEAETNDRFAGRKTSTAGA